MWRYYNVEIRKLFYWIQNFATRKQSFVFQNLALEPHGLSADPNDDWARTKDSGFDCRPTEPNVLCWNYNTILQQKKVWKHQSLLKEGISHKATVRIEQTFGLGGSTGARIPAILCWICLRSW